MEQTIKVTLDNEKAINENMRKDGWRLKNKSVQPDGSVLAVYEKTENRTQMNG